MKKIKIFLKIKLKLKNKIAMNVNKIIVMIIRN